MQYDLEQWQSSRWSKGTRYYSIELCQDIFGDWVIRRTWGSQASQKAKVKSQKQYKSQS